MHLDLFVWGSRAVEHLTTIPLDTYAMAKSNSYALVSIAILIPSQVRHDKVPSFGVRVAHLLLGGPNRKAILRNIRVDMKFILQILRLYEIIAEALLSTKIFMYLFPIVFHCISN